MIAGEDTGCTNQVRPWSQSPREADIPVVSLAFQHFISGSALLRQLLAFWRNMAEGTGFPWCPSANIWLWVSQWMTLVAWVLVLPWCCHSLRGTCFACGADILALSSRAGPHDCCWLDGYPWVPAASMGGSDMIQDFWLQPGPAPHLGGEQVDRFFFLAVLHLSLPFSLSVCLPKKINLSKTMYSFS